MRAIVTILDVDYEVQFSGRQTNSQILVTVEGMRRKGFWKSVVVFGPSLDVPAWLGTLIAEELEERDDVRAEFAAARRA